ncbi:MAG: hypothetical protein Q9164_000101 [Protoblastenia rupestris]
MATQQNADDDPFEYLLDLEDQFYNTGYRSGVADGEHAGRVEGRSVGLKAGFEKYIMMGRLHGKAAVWAGRLPTQEGKGKLEERPESIYAMNTAERPTTTQESHNFARSIPTYSRLKTHIKTMYALAEPASLSTDNSEESVANFDDRLKRAEGKAKVIGKIIGEANLDSENATKGELQLKSIVKTNGGIEDMDVLHARH